MRNEWSPPDERSARARARADWRQQAAPLVTGEAAHGGSWSLPCVTLGEPEWTARSNVCSAPRRRLT